MAVIVLGRLFFLALLPTALQAFVVQPPPSTSALTSALILKVSQKNYICRLSRAFFLRSVVSSRVNERAVGDTAANVGIWSPVDLRVATATDPVGAVISTNKEPIYRRTEK